MSALSISNDNKDEPFTDSPRHYDLVPLYNGYMKFVREEYEKGNQLVIASPYIDGETLLALVMNTGGRQLIEKHRDALRPMYKVHLNLLLEDEKKKEKEEGNEKQEKIAPMLFIVLEKYNSGIIAKKSEDKNPATHNVSDDAREACRGRLQEILREHFDLRLQPPYNHPGYTAAFRSKFVASKPASGNCNVLFTNANLITKHMQREQPLNGFQQRQLAFFTEMKQDEFKANLQDMLEAICLSVDKTPNNNMAGVNEDTAALSTNNDNRAAPFGELPRLYDLVPLYNGYMKFVREEYEKGNQLVIASPFINGDSALALVMNTGGRQLLEQYWEALRPLYEVHLNALMAEEKKRRSEEHEKCTPILFVQFTKYNDCDIVQQKHDENQATRHVTNLERAICLEAVKTILRAHFDLRLQPPYGDPDYTSHFHCKWAASKPSHGQCSVLLTSANLIKEEMQRERPSNGYHQCSMAHIVKVERDVFNRDFQGVLEKICFPAGLVLEQQV